MVNCDEIDKCPQTRKNKGFALANPLFFSGCSGRDRTCDQVINSHLLYR